jgi:hypothetical protein
MLITDEHAGDPMNDQGIVTATGSASPSTAISSLWPRGCRGSFVLIDIRGVELG